MKADLDQDEQGKAEAQKLVPAADETLRPKDKYVRALALVVVCITLPLRIVRPWGGGACVCTLGSGHNFPPRIQAALQGLGGHS